MVAGLVGGGEQKMVVCAKGTEGAVCSSCLYLYVYFIVFGSLPLYVQGAAKKSNPLSYFSNF